MNVPSKHHAPGYESTDAPVRPIAIAVTVLTAGIIVAMGAAALLLAAQNQARPTTAPLGAHGAFTHGSRAMPDIERSWDDIERERAARGAGYAWIDREHGFVRIPVERAMELLVQEAEEERR